jgi:hypothetical protein
VEVLSHSRCSPFDSSLLIPSFPRVLLLLRSAMQRWTTSISGGVPQVHPSRISSVIHAGLRGGLPVGMTD